MNTTKKKFQLESDKILLAYQSAASSRMAVIKPRIEAIYASVDTPEALSIEQAEEIKQLVYEAEVLKATVAGATLFKGNIDEKFGTKIQSIDKPEEIVEDNGVVKYTITKSNPNVF